MSAAAHEITATRASGGADADQPAHASKGQPASADAGQSGRRWRWLAFAVVIAASVIDLLDSTITQVAAPAIRRELGGSYAVIEWVTAAMARA